MSLEGNIWVVDDDRGARQKANVIECESSYSCMSLMEAGENPRMILLDTQASQSMQGGCHLLRWIRMRSSFLELPVMVISSDASVSAMPLVFSCNQVTQDEGQTSLSMSDGEDERSPERSTASFKRGTSEKSFQIKRRATPGPEPQALKKTVTVDVANKKVATGEPGISKRRVGAQGSLEQVSSNVSEKETCASLTHVADRQACQAPDQGKIADRERCFALLRSNEVLDLQLPDTTLPASNTMPTIPFAQASQRAQDFAPGEFTSHCAGPTPSVSSQSHQGASMASRGSEAMHRQAQHLLLDNQQLGQRCHVLERSYWQVQQLAEEGQAQARRSQWETNFWRL